MTRAGLRTLEQVADVGAAAILAAAVVFACARFGQGPLPAAAAAIAVFAIAAAALRRVASGTGFALGAWAPAEFAFEPEPDEMLLTDRYEPASAGEEPLLLDDVLEALAPDARVVRLFNPAALPSPGQMQQSIDQHLRTARRPAAPPDASQALHLALAELRRSLR